MSGRREAEIALLRAWIDAGAKGPDGAEPTYPELSTPEIGPRRNVADVSHQPRPVARWQAACAGQLSSRRSGRSGDAASAGDHCRAPRQGEQHSLFRAMAHCSSPRREFPGCMAWPRSAARPMRPIVSQIKGHRDALYDARLSPTADCWPRAATIARSIFGMSRAASWCERCPATTAPSSSWRFRRTARSWPAPVPMTR